MKGYILIGLITLALISGCIQKETPTIPDLTNKELCEAAGGTWNECGSPCAGTDADLCIQVCRAQCECNKDSECPQSYHCRTGKIKPGACITCPNEIIPKITPLELEHGWYFSSYCQKKPGTPSNWVHVSEGTRSAMWKDPDITVGQI